MLAGVGRVRLGGDAVGALLGRHALRRLLPDIRDQGQGPAPPTGRPPIVSPRLPGLTSASLLRGRAGRAGPGSTTRSGDEIGGGLVSRAGRSGPRGGGGGDGGVVCGRGGRAGRRRGVPMPPPPRALCGAGVARGDGWGGAGPKCR